LKGFSGAAVIRQRLAEAVTFEAFLRLLAEIRCGESHLS